MAQDHEAKVQEVERPDLDQFLSAHSVVWYKDAGLRKLYLMMPILFLGATTNGYDGSLLNGLQTMNPWQDCKFNVSWPVPVHRIQTPCVDFKTDFGHPDGSTLGLFSAILQVGAFSAIFFCRSAIYPASHFVLISGSASYVADFFGRKKGVAIGVVVIVVGVILQGESFP